MFRRMNREGLVPRECMPQRKLYRVADGSWRGEVSCRCTLGEKEYFILNEYGWIIEHDLSGGGMRPMAAVPGFEIYRENAYRGMETDGQELVIYPEEAEGIFYYDLQNGQMRKIFDKNLEAEEKLKRPQIKNELLEIQENVVAAIRAELFKKGNLDHTWYEGDTYTLQDYFYFLQTAGEQERKGYIGSYQVWLATMDGTCGEKIYNAVKGSLQ